MPFKRSRKGEPYPRTAPLKEAPCATPTRRRPRSNDVLTDWRGSQDAMMWTSNEPPPPTVEATKARWGWRTVKIMAFLYLWIAGTHLTAELITGVWGGTPQDPLWLGAVSTGVGLAVGSVAAILGVTTIERIRNRPR